MNSGEARRQVFASAIFQEGPSSGRVLLRDGSAAIIRITTLGDRSALREFFGNLSEESRRRRFMSRALPDDRLIETLADSSNPNDRLTLVVTRLVDGRETVVATGTYMSRGDANAEVSMAVDDRFQGMGLGTHLLERLSVIAIHHGFRRFWAITEMDNHGMIDVFRQSGFPVRERVDAGIVEIEFEVTPTESNVQLSEMRDRLSTAASIRPFFKPNAVAVIGASRDPSSIGYRILDELLRAGFKGLVYAINPKASTIGAVKTYASIRDVPTRPDLAIVAVPQNAVLGVVDECAAKGVRAIIAITAGFSETGESGRQLQAELLRRIRGNGMRMIGPNCMGVLNTDPTVRLNASFSPEFPLPGNLAMSSQSGALGLAVLALAAERHLGLSTFVSVGNKADVSGNDLLQYWETDEQTKVILLYLESFGNPRRFARLARRIGRTKPILAVKAGRTHAGRRAAGSHTAALAADDAAVDALFLQTGVIRAETIDELFDAASLLGNQPLTRGRRVAIVTNAGGPGILCADACEAGGLEVAELSAAGQAELRGFLPPAATVSNPVDMVASAGPENYRKTIETVLASPDTDALVVIYIPVDRDDTHRISKAIRAGIEDGRKRGGTEKPVLACLMTASMRKEPLRTEHETIPVYAFPESAAKALAKCAAYSEWQKEPGGIVPGFDDTHPDAARQIVRGALSTRGQGWLAPNETRAVLEAFGISQPPSEVATTADDAAAAAERLGFPVAIKLVSADVVHKTEAGGVRLNIKNAGEVRQAFDSMTPARNSSAWTPATGVLVQSMVEGGVELMMGITSDPLFGPLIAFGLGGVHVEILRDVQFRVAPLTDRDAHKMVRGIRGFRLLEGYRGHAPADIGAVENILLRLSMMAEEIPEIADVDLNPIIALPPGKGCCAVDARIRVVDVHRP